MNLVTKATDGFMETEIDGEVVVMRLSDGDFYSLKDSGLAIWKAIDGKRDRDALLDLLRAQFDAPEAQLSADLDAFLADLRDAGLLARP